MVRQSLFLQCSSSASHFIHLSPYLSSFSLVPLNFIIMAKSRPSNSRPSILSYCGTLPPARTATNPAPDPQYPRHHGHRPPKRVRPPRPDLLHRRPNQLRRLPQRYVPHSFSLPLSPLAHSQSSPECMVIGWDKTYSLRHVQDEGFDEIHFFGDKVCLQGVELRNHRIWLMGDRICLTADRERRERLRDLLGQEGYRAQREEPG